MSQRGVAWQLTTALRAPLRFLYMWNSNSVIAWVIARSGIDTESIQPPAPELAATLRAHRPRNAIDDAFVFPGRDGGPSDQGSLRRRVLIPPPRAPD